MVTSFALGQLLKDVATEAAAIEALGPIDAIDMTKFMQEDVRICIQRQWWKLAQQLIKRSHEAKVDISSTVRSTVREVKQQADELLRSLDPSYGKPIVVSPAFQFAQNATDYIIHVKFTTRWNAPGGLEAKDPSMKFTDYGLEFEGKGEHSGNKYLYKLSLDFFDRIVPDQCRYDMASVGKMMVYVRKAHARKWPRLLAKKKKTIANMHVWMEMQEKLDATFSGQAASHSPRTCAEKKKVYCLHKDKCVPDCSECPNKLTQHATRAECNGPPAETNGLSVSFSDKDMSSGELGGSVLITKSTELDVDSYRVYWSMGDSKEGRELLATTGDELEVSIPANTPVNAFSHLQACPVNSMGEGVACVITEVRDAAVPLDRPEGCLFVDVEGSLNEVGGKVSITRAKDESLLKYYSVYWGKNARTKISSNAYLGQVDATGADVAYTVSHHTTIPKGATHFLIFAKNDDGERYGAIGCPIIDNVRPLVTADEVRFDGETITVIGSDKKTDSYVVWWGTADCTKNSVITEIVASDTMSFTLPKGSAPPVDATHVLVFSKNAVGESEKCVSADVAARAPNAEL